AAVRARAGAGRRGRAVGAARARAGADRRARRHLRADLQPDGAGDVPRRHADQSVKLKKIGEWLLGPWQRLRLRTKLTSVLVLAALVPMVLVATIAVTVVLGTLDRGLHDETERQREVGLNLILRAVERLGDDASRLAGTGDMSRAITAGQSE